MNIYFNKNNLSRIFAIALLIFLLVLFCHSTPYESPSFSHESGFYQDDFYLEITAGDGLTIHYTLDGSVPDASSPVYTQPLLISDATSKPNVYSAIKDISAHESVIVPDYNVDKCTIVRAVAISSLGTFSKDSTASYFVGITPEKYNNFNIVSIITNPENMFDYYTGIYVKGHKYDEYLLNGDQSKATYYWDCNYNQRGIDWERESYVQFFNGDGQLVLEKDTGIRIRGATSRAKVQKGFNLYCRPQYDGTEQFGVDLFDNGYIPQSVSLMNGGNEPALQFQDYAMTYLCHSLNLSAALYKPYVTFLNGEFWGFYWLAEKYDQHYFSHYYNVKPDNVVMIKGETVELGEEKDIILYNDMVSFISNNDMSDAVNYEKACQMIDIDSFIDYYASMMYVARSHDWLNYNTALWRTRTSDDNVGFSDGRWRWILFDCNGFTMGIASPSSFDHNTLAYALEKSPVFRSLWNNKDFRCAFQQRIIYLGDTLFNQQITSNLINSFSEQMYPVMSQSWRRWYGSDNSKSEEFYTKLAIAKEFFEKRNTVVKSWF